MDYSLAPPENLQEIALIAVATSLFTQGPVKDEILIILEYRSERDFDKKWNKIDEKVKDRIEAITLPQALKVELSGISTQVGLEILEWAKYYSKYYCESAFFDNICWTPQGAIDEEKTARRLVNDQSLSVLKRYKIACVNCFEDVIHDLWKQLNKNEEHLGKIKKSRRYDILAVFWSYYICGKSNEIIGEDSANEYGLKAAVDQGNSVAVKYFWKKLTFKEKEENSERCIITAARESCDDLSVGFSSPRSCYTYILCFLLNQVSEEQQLKAFTYNIEVSTLYGKRDSKLGYFIFRSLLHFPYQKIFLPTSEQVCHFLEEKEYYSLLYYTAKKIHHYPKSYRNILNYTWQKILDQKLPVNISKIGSVLSELCKIGDNGSIELILSGLSSSEKETLIFSYEGRGICRNLIRQDKWKGLEFFLRCCLTTKDIALNFKEKEQISHQLLENDLHDKAGKFTKLVGDFIASFEVEHPVQKRKIEDDDTPIKKIKTDLVIKFKDVSVVVECKADNTTAEKAIQQIKVTFT